MEKNKFNIIEVIKELKKNNRIFCSEADFQHTLAWTIKQKYENKIKKIYLEFPFIIKEEQKKQEEHNHLDILIVFKDNKMIPIELKYKTTYPNANKKKKGELYENSDENIKFIVRNQGAKNYGCYNYIKDISRIESFKKDNMFKDDFEEGYAIFLTNDKNYWEEVENYKQEEPTYDYSMFSIHHKRENVHGKLDWKKHKKDNKGKTLYPLIDIEGSYDFCWNPYYNNYKEYNSNEDFGEFKYLITTIKK